MFHHHQGVGGLLDGTGPKRDKGCLATPQLPPTAPPHSSGSDAAGSGGPTKAESIRQLLLLFGMLMEILTTAMLSRRCFSLDHRD